MPEKSKSPQPEPEDLDRVTPEEMQSAHPVEPAEGAREPGKDALAPRVPHPSEPAEGDR
jgi:hypothetical protein